LSSHATENSVQNQLFVHFGVRENPFGGTPDPRFLFHSETHREALASLINGIDCEFGFQVLVAQPGMGKTTLLFNFLERFREDAHTAFLFQPQLEPHELLQSLLLELGVVSDDKSVRKLSEQINQLVSRAAQEHKRVIVVVDEAQNLDFAVLEALRQLSNFETARVKLMQIVLAGQPELVKKLAAPEQEQLRQRISTIGRLSPLTYNETRAYINHRLRTAGYKGSELFTLGAARRIWESAKGVPRKINTLCFNAMLLGFATHAKSIDESILDEAARDLDMTSVLADIYRTEPSLAGVHRLGLGKVQPGWEAKPETEQATPLQKTEAGPGAAPRGNGNNGGTTESIPLALVEAIVRISQTLEEQKVLLAAKSIPSAKSVPATTSSASATVPVLAATGTIAAAVAENQADANRKAAPAVSDTKAGSSIQSPKSATPDKESPVTPDKALLPVTKSAFTKNPQPMELSPKPGLAAKAIPKSLTKPVTKSPSASSYLPVSKQTSEGAGFWLKALALAAMTSILTFVVVERSLSQHPAEANAPEDRSSVSEQGNSSSGYVVPRGSPESPMDTPLRPSRETTNLRGRRASGSDELDDVTVRKFEPATVRGVSSGTEDSNTILFDQNSAAIDGQYHLTLQGIADELAKDPQASAIIEGHTDDSGPEAYNLDLSSRRAIAVREALINEFNVPSTQVTAIGSGSAAPARPNSSATGRAHNRRVAVRFVKLGE
jgi:type II secretory pathway predicted ATPase ExeA/outer membrane protein OmpA-like peptidoglycan-associated protein